MARRQLIRLLPRLAGGAKVGAAGGVAGLAAGGISSIIKSLGVDQAVDAGEAALQTPMFEPIKRKEEVVEFRSPSVRDLFDEIEVKPKEIVPELGPEEDRYEKHLNLIIERVARLEGEAATQNELIARLRSTVKDSDDQQRRFNLEEKRKASEDDIEGRNRTKEAFEKIKQGAATTGRNVAAMLKALSIPVAAFTASHFLNRFAEGEEGSEQTLESVINVAEKVFDVGAQLGAVGALSSRFLTAAPGSLTASVAARGAAMGDAIRSVSRMAPTGGQLFPTATGAVQSSVSTAVQTVAPNAAKAKQMTQKLGMLQRMARGLQRGADSLTGRVLDWAKRLPARLANFMQRAARKILKWYLIWESIQFMYRLVERYAMGTIDEQELHEGNKQQINNIISLLGTPMLMSFLGGLVGGALGGTILSIVPFLGTLVGGLGGVAVGKIVGLTIGIIFGDKIYEFLPISKIVDAIYDFIVRNADTIKNIFVNVLRWVTIEIPKLLGRALLDALNPTRIITRGINAVRERFDSAPNVDSDFETDPGPPIETPIPPLRDGVTTSVIMREGGTREMTEEEIHTAFDEGLISIAARDSALSILERDRVREERRVASQEVNPQSTSTAVAVAQTVNPTAAEDVTINFSEFDLHQADPALYNEFITYKTEAENEYFEERESRNVRNNRTITQANRQIARTKAHKIAAVYYQNEINNALGPQSVIVTNNTNVTNNESFVTNTGDVTNNESFVTNVSTNFSEFDLHQADPALHEEFVIYKQEVEQQHFEEREQRNVRNNRTITQANRQIARTKAHRDASVYFKNEINNVLGSNSVVVNNQTTQNQNNVVNNQTLQNQNNVVNNQTTQNQNNIVSNERSVRSVLVPATFGTDSKGRTIVVPVIQEPPKIGQSLSQSIAVGPKSQLDSASPTYNTSDSFLDLGLVT